MTDNEIVKAFTETYEQYNAIGDFRTTVYKEVLDLINRQKAKIESLEVSLESMRSVAKGFQSAHAREKGARNTAIQDFAERLKGETLGKHCMYFNFEITNAIIDNLVKEMTGAQQ